MSKVLSDYAEYVSERVEGSALTPDTYVGVDNLLPNKGGIAESKYAPEDGIAFKKGDILLGNIRPYFKKIWLAEYDGGCSPDVLCIRCKKGISPLFIYALLAQDKFFDYNVRGAKGSKMPRGDKNHIMSFPVTELNNPEKIGKLVYDIYLKIQNNTAICAELEAMAKLVYDYWFVQFDFPDENGKPYKSSGGKMMWNDELKREIPEGWEVITFGDCITSINTGLNPRDNFKLNTGGTIKYLTVKNLTTDGNIDFSSCDFIDENARAIVHRRSDIKIGDILFASIAPLGRCCIIMDTPKDWDINESVFAIRPNYENMTSIFLYMTFMSDAFIKKAEGSSTGSVFKGIRIAELQGLKTILPPKQLLDRFDEQIQKLFTMKANVSEESRQLVSLRDFLLPMLMNGQVKVAGR